MRPVQSGLWSDSGRAAPLRHRAKERSRMLPLQAGAPRAPLLLLLAVAAALAPRSPCKTDRDCSHQGRDASCTYCTDQWQHNWTAGVCNKALPTGPCDGYGCTDANCTTHGHIVQPCQCLPFACLKPDVIWPSINWSSPKPKYLMVGDSISIQMAGGLEFYPNGTRLPCPVEPCNSSVHGDGGVFDLLRNSTEGTHNPGNAANSNKGAQCVESWLGQLEAPSGGCKLDKISFNFGIHDCNMLPGGYPATESIPLPDYKRLLTAVVQKLQGRCPKAKLLYVTTTPVATNKTDPTKPGSTSLLNNDVEAVNVAAKEIMAQREVVVLDMYQFVVDHCGEAYVTCDWQCDATGCGVHFHPEGWRAMAQRLASAVLAL